MTINLSNPIVKTLVTGLAAVLLPSLDAALQNPTGGMLAALQHNPVYAYEFTGLALLVHNVYTHFEQTSTPSSSTPQSK